MNDNTRVVRKPVQAKECQVISNDPETGWAVWFAPNRRVGKEGMYGGPSLVILRLVEDGYGNKLWLQLWRLDFFALEGFGGDPLSNHEHDDAWSLDDPEHKVTIEPGKNPLNVLVRYLEYPTEFANVLIEQGRRDQAASIPEVAFRAGAEKVREIMAAHCAAHGVPFPLRVAQPAGAR